MEKKKVLLVEDTLNLLKLGKAIFDSGGYDVITAADGEEALAALADNTIALIVTDILMPNMDGYSLCYHVRNDEQYKDIPIILYSATYTSQSDEGLAMDIGANMFIRKPASMGFILNAARELISAEGKLNTNEPIRKQELKNVMRQYNSRLIEKLEHKNLELEKAQDELVKSEKRFRALIENNFEAITLKDEKGKVLYQSPSAQRMVGYTAEETNGRNATDFFHPDDIPDVLKRLETAMKNPGIPVYGINRMMHKDGHLLWIEGTTTNLLENENVKAIVGNFRDITEQKNAEIERAKMMDDIVQRNKNLEQFSYIVSHNLRAPVANILGIAAILNDLELNGTEKILLGQGLTESVKKLDEVVKDLNHILELKGDMNKLKEKVHFSSLVEDITLSINNIIAKNLIDIRCDFSEINEFFTIRSYLYSIFFNLISNSIKYQKPEIAPVIEISSAMRNNNLLIFFKDNGLGIDLKKRGDQVFGMYKRFHTHVEGKGMGLFMVKTQIESLGGTISISSEVNAGTEFTIAFEIN
ncbi:MAG: domain S-box [Flavipsychrobacter sp.]|nr:domain S-box [Flavipsychrobacter sp.]